MKASCAPLCRSIRFAVLALLTLASCAATRQEPAPADDRPDYLFGVLAGGRSLDDDVAWEDLESPVMLGVEGGNVGRPLGYEVGLSIAGDSTDVAGVDVSNRFLELSAGGRLIFGEGTVLPYLGAGLALVMVEIEAEDGGLTASDDDVTPGFYGHGGILFRVGERFHLGLDARLMMGTEVDLVGIESDADYAQLAAVFAWGG